MRLLILEDDSKLQAILSHHLSVAGHDVRSATSLKHAAALVAASPVDLVITDWRASDACGSDLCQALRKSANDANLRILMINAPQTQCAAENCIPKPFDLGRFMSAVRVAMHQMPSRQAA